MIFPILDLETTGLTVAPGAILEVSIVIMDTNFHERETYTQAVKQYYLPITLSHMNDWATKTHTESRLLKDVEESTKTIVDIEYGVLDLLKRHFGSEKPVLVGNSIHFDRAFIKAYMPRLDEALHYRMLDVSALWEYMRIFHGTQRPNNGPIVHRGIPDTRGSAKLLQQFGEYINTNIEGAVPNDVFNK